MTTLTAGTNPTVKLNSLIADGDLARLAELFTDNSILDVHVHDWWFQRKGAEDIVEQFREWYADGPPEEATWTEHHAEFGSIVEVIERRKQRGEELFFQYVYLAHLESGKITKLTLYCPGGQDAETEARNRREAPFFEGRD